MRDRREYDVSQNFATVEHFQTLNLPASGERGNRAAAGGHSARRHREDIEIQG